MTEQEWLAQSDYEKNLWIRSIFHKAATSWKDLEHKDYLNWQGFGMVVEKCFDDIQLVFFKNGVRLYVAKEPTHQRAEYICVKAPTPWEAAALAYGKMKGLIKYGVRDE